MSILIRLRDGIAHVSTGDPELPLAPFRTAIVEAAGALLHWDVTADGPLPDADIDDLAAAAGWLVDVYGTDVAEAASAGADASLPVDPADARAVDGVLRLGHLTWARAWWPAGARIPALDPALLAAEIALTGHAVSHLLDDDDAVERALQDAADVASALAALPPALAADRDALTAALDELADDNGVVLLPARNDREEWALAAGGTERAETGIEVATGTAAVRWGDVPAQTVDAEGEARWSLRQRSGTVILHVEVPAVDTASAARSLHARFGPADSGADVALERDGGRFVGETEVAASVAFLPAGERSLWVRDRVLAATTGAAESGEDRARVIRFAAVRLGSPDASLAERAAGAVR